MSNEKKKKSKVGLIIFFVFLLIGFFLGTKLFKLYFPLEYIDIIEEKSNKYNLDISFVVSVIRAESRFRKDVVSKKDAKGLMQLTKATADWGAIEIGLENYSYDKIFEPEINIELGCWYLNKLSTQYNGDKNLILAGYNAGTGNVAKWLNNFEYSKDGIKLDEIPFSETKDYIKRINFFEKIYDYILEYKKIYDFL